MRAPAIRLKRVYEAPDPGDGKRILVDRLWPRGLTKEKARVDHWAKAASPSQQLRRWYRHEPEKWAEFRARYFAELDANPEGVSELRVHLGGGAVTFVYSSTEERLNNAAALSEYLQTTATGEEGSAAETQTEYPGTRGDGAPDAVRRASGDCARGRGADSPSPTRGPVRARARRRSTRANPH